MPQRVLVALALVLVVACEQPPPEMACVPGETQRCIGRDGCDGVQVCVVEGTGYNACRCNRRDAGSPDAGPSDAGPPDAGPPDGGTTDAGVDGGAFVPPPPSCAGWEGGSEAVFLVAALTLPTDDEGRLPGFDLDGLDSGAGSSAADATCEEYQVDWVSPYDAVSGVDAALNGLKATWDSLYGSTDAELGRMLHDGELLLLVRLRELDHPTDDLDVLVTLYAADAPSGGVALGADGRLAPDQSFTATALASAVGALTGGRLRVALGDLSFTAASGALFPRSAIGTELAFDLCRDGLERGVFAGSVTVDELATRAEEEMPGVGDTVRSVLESVADLGASAVDPAVCERLGFSYELEGVPATLL